MSLGHRRFRVGAWTIDPGLNQISAGDRESRLEPKVMGVLVYLAERPGQTVSRGELLDALWGGTAVVEEALTRCVSQLRRSLEDDPQQPRYIQTVPKRGYRLVAPVAVDEPPGLPSPSAAPAPPDDERNPPAPVQAAANVVWTRRWPLVLAACAIVAVALGVWAMRSTGPVPRGDAASANTGAVAPQPLIVVAPFSVEGKDAELQILGLMMADLLQARLAQVPGLVVLREGAASARNASSSGDAILDRTTLTGSVRRTADDRRAHLILDLREPTRGGAARVFTLAEFDLPFLREDASLSAFVQAREAVVRRVLERLLPVFEMPESDPSRPADLEGYRLYLQASGRILQRAVCDAAVLDLVHRSLEIDPDYAPAWMLLGWTHYGRVSACGEGEQHYDEALRAAGRAAALDSTSVDPTLLEVVALAERGQVEDAYERIVKSRAGLTPSAPLSFAAAYALTYAGFVDEASMALDEALARNPWYLTDGGWTPNALLYRRNWDAFLALLPGTDTPIFRWYRGVAELERGRSTAAATELTDVFERYPQDVFARLSLALSAVIAGRTADARTAVLALAQHREAIGSRDGELTFKQAQVLAAAGDRESALAELDRAVTQGFFCAACIEATPLLDSLRASPAYRAILQRARTRHEAFGRRFGLTPGRE